MSKWPAHPAAELFPMLSAEELQALADDIKGKGQLEAIVLYDGQVLDGRNRLAACELAGVEPRTITMGFRAGDIGPAEWVISKNLRRRHLTHTESAAVGVEALPMLEAEARERLQRAGANHGVGQKGKEKVPDPNAGQARDQAAALVGVNPRYISLAKAIKRDAPDQFEAMKAGKVTIQQAKREVARRLRRDELAIKFEERQTSPPESDAAVSDAMAEAAQRKAVAHFIRDLDVCVEALFRVMPSRGKIAVKDSDQSKDLDRVAAELEQIARDVRAYKEDNVV